MVYLTMLAQPNHSYALYLSPERSVFIPTGEAINLRDDGDVLRLPAISSEKNPLYIPLDTDKDGIIDRLDNCVNSANADQVDANRNGRGDVCDDFDKDGIVNSKDNCPDNPNRNQRYEDGDNIGDVCDGQESRITERLPWIPWAGTGFAGLVLISLFVIAIRQKIDVPKNDIFDSGA